MELLHKHAVKPNAKSLREEPPDVKILCSLWYEFRVRDEILYCTGKEMTDEWKLVIPRDKRMEILYLLHNSQTAGHPGMSRMKLTVCSRFYWSRMRKDVENWLTCCRPCSMAKRGLRQQRAPLQQEINGASFDVIGPLPTKVNGNRFILTMIDYFSKWAEAYALPNNKVETVADCIVNRWIAHHGIPMRIHSDNAPEFRGHIITQLKNMLSMKGTFTTPYRPQSNGLCERMNQMIENIIKCTVREERSTWDKSLDLVMMAYLLLPRYRQSSHPICLGQGRKWTFLWISSMDPRTVEEINIITIVIVHMLKSFEIRWSMHISEPGNVWATQLSDRKCTVTGILPLVILRKETGSFIGIN